MSRWSVTLVLAAATASLAAQASDSGDWISPFPVRGVVLRDRTFYASIPAGAGTLSRRVVPI